MLLFKTIFALSVIAGSDEHRDSGVAHTFMHQETIDSLVDFALDYQFEKYRLAGKQPGGFDCSGFMYYVFGYFNIKMPGSSKNVKSVGIEVPLSEVRPGDIIYFTGRNSKSSVPGHVGMVIKTGADGSIFFIHASVQKGVTVDELHFDYYKKRFLGVRRVTL